MIKSIEVTFNENKIKYKLTKVDKYDIIVEEKEFPELALIMELTDILLIPNQRRPKKITVEFE